MKRVLAALTAAYVGLAMSGCGSDGPVSAAKPTSTSTTQAQTWGSSAANAFVEYAEGGTDKVPWGGSVTYSIGGVQVGTFTPGPSVSGELSACLPGKSEVEGHTCPVSPLKTVSEDAGHVVFEPSLPGRVGCNTFSPPNVPNAWTPTVIRPPEARRDCFSDFAVTLFVNESGNVVGIDFALSGP